MKLKFSYIQDSEGKISNLTSIRPTELSGGTYGDEILLSCLKGYGINQDNRGFTFNLQYDGVMQRVLEVLK